MQSSESEEGILCQSRAPIVAGWTFVCGIVEGVGWRKSRLRVREFNARWNAFLAQIASRRHMTLGSL